MIVKQYGITYTRISKNDLELVRYWRNQNYIRNNMQFKEYITPSMQRNWFSKIDNKLNYYFIIIYDNKKIGLINCKETAAESRIAEGGIFIWDKSFWGTSVPALAALTMLQSVFEIFKSGTASLATIDKENKIAIDFNLHLGYKIIGSTPNEKCYKMLLTLDDYLTKTKKLLKAAKYLSNSNDKLELYAEVNDRQLDEVNNYIINNRV